MDEIRTLLEIAKNYHRKITYNHKYENTYLICLHGYASSPNSFQLIGDNLQNDYNIECLTLQTFKHSISEMANEVEEFLTFKYITKYIIVGHSLGGIVALYHQQNFAKIQAIVTVCIATPLFGTGLAKFGYGKVATEILPTSEILKIILRRMCFSKQKIILIQSSNDWIITKYIFPKVNDFIDSITISNSSHCSILNNSEIFEILKNLVK